MEEPSVIRFVLSFVFILALIGCLPVLLRYVTRFKMNLGQQNQPGRLTVIETRYLDPKRRLVLIRCDDKEHLLLLSADRELIVDSNIAVDTQHTPKQPANDHE